MMINASTRYALRSIFIAAIFVVSIFVAKRLIVEHGVSGPLAHGLALIPGLVMIGFFWSTGKLIIETEDEFLRMLAARQQLIATGFTMSVASVWGTLELLKLVPHVEAIYLIVVWSIGMIVGQIANRITHGAWGA